MTRKHRGLSGRLLDRIRAHVAVAEAQLGVSSHVTRHRFALLACGCDSNWMAGRFLRVAMAVGFAQGRKSARLRLVDLEVTERLVIPESELEWTAVRASGPGGQNVNKVATKVDLRFDFEASAALSEAVKRRLARLAGPRVDAQGRLVITSQASRSQAKNLEDAREKLAELIRAALVVPKPRRATRPTRGAVRRRLEDKRRRAETKARRRKVD